MHYKDVGQQTKVTGKKVLIKYKEKKTVRMSKVQLRSRLSRETVIILGDP